MADHTMEREGSRFPQLGAVRVATVVHTPDAVHHTAVLDLPAGVRVSGEDTQK